MNTFKRLMLCLFLLTSWPALAEEKIVSALPILHGLNLELLKGTDISPVYLPPKRLPVTRISNWLQHKSRESISELESVTAFSTVESIWPEFALFPHLRVNNVRVLPVDAAKEILSGGAQVSLAEEDIKEKAYFWLLPDNLIVMNQILARDYARIWPQHAQKINENQFELQKQIQNYKLSLDQLLLDKEVESICLSNTRLEPLAQAAFLPVERADHCSSGALEIIQMKRGTQPESGKWIIDAADKPLKYSIPEWFQANLSALQQALI